MYFGGKTGCIEKMFVKLEMTRASPGSSLVYIIKVAQKQKFLISNFKCWSEKIRGLFLF